MKKWLFIPGFLLFFALGPVHLASAQAVRYPSAYQHYVLLTTVAAFGLMLGLFWLSRLLPKGTVNMKLSSIMRWHTYIGYTTGLFFLIHPAMMLSRHLWRMDALPIQPLLLMFKSPRMLTGTLAWFLLMLLVVTALTRKAMPAKVFRSVHGLIGAVFTGLATAHVIQVGPHSSRTMSAFWMALAGVAVAALLLSYVSLYSKKIRIHIHLGGQHESA
jgi:predicted ferric reductase